jgi:hypothetical protein
MSVVTTMARTHSNHIASHDIITFSRTKGPVAKELASTDDPKINA